MSDWRRDVSVAALVVAAGCGGDPPTQPPPPAPQSAALTILSGATATDTVGTLLPEPLAIRVTTADGLPAVARVVRFRVRPRSEPPGAHPLCIGAASADVGCSNYEDSVQTDVQGRAETGVRFRFRAGTAVIDVSVPSLALLDSAVYTITPGTLRFIRADPRDSVLLVGGSYTLRVIPQDKSFNPRPDPVTFTLISGPVALTPTGVVTGLAIGRAEIRVGAPGRDTTVHVSVAPPATFTASSFVSGRIVSFRSDGANMIDLLPPSVPGGMQWPAWSPDGNKLAWVQGGHIWVRVNGGTPAIVTPASISLVTTNPIVFGGSGEWLYFSRESPLNNAQSGWRMRWDGTGLSQVTDPAVIANPFIPRETNPAPDPQETRVIYESTRDTPMQTTLWMRSLTDGTVQPLGRAGRLARWSPDGARIAFQDSLFRLSTMNPDGSGLMLHAEGRIAGNYAWSPDGQWIIAYRFDPSRHLVLVSMVSDLQLPLYLGSFGSVLLEHPVWRP